MLVSAQLLFPTFCCLATEIVSWFCLVYLNSFCVLQSTYAFRRALLFLPLPVEIVLYHIDLLSPSFATLVCRSSAAAA